MTERCSGCGRRYWRLFGAVRGLRVCRWCWRDPRRDPRRGTPPISPRDNVHGEYAHRVGPLPPDYSSADV